MKTPVPSQQPPVSEGLVAFDRSAAERTRDVVKYVESFYRNPPPGGIAPPRGGGGSCLVMVVTTTITAMSGSTAGTGFAKIATFNPSTLAMGTGTGSALAIYSYHEKKFIAGAYISAFPWANVLWVFDVDKCVNYS